ncbi:MAG: SUMF1/EgtB/PvdO family nonheme iron enzyme, partial [Flavobacteriales bacterium]|nr:SUMF1/EgtB/PvdO family nonheme iron enzyme [Flavobacteriales bacterium]
SDQAPYNWDAAWLFVKFLNAGTGQWEHARLSNDVYHVAPAGSTISTGRLNPGAPFNVNNNYGLGVFIHRDADGSGTFTASGVQLRWYYGTNGVTYDDIQEVSVIAIEMVYVPEGSFYVGSSGQEVDHFTNGPANAPFQITSEAALSVANTPGSLWTVHIPGVSETFPPPGTLSAAFPKGHGAFYMMKHEVAQQDYVDFLNTLTRVQQNARTRTDLAPGVSVVTNRYVMSGTSGQNNRNGIRCAATVPPTAPVSFYCDLNNNGTGGESNDGQWIACNHLTWSDLAAYLDWCGLRPMTELEYEKACRGPAFPVNDQYAWGGPGYTLSNGMTGSGTINEASSTTGSNASQPVMRVGAFAAGATTRAQAGAGYYGALNLSDNVAEWSIPVNDEASALSPFTGTHGDGMLSVDGEPNAATWPADGSHLYGFRGARIGSDLFGDNLWYSGVASRRGASHDPGIGEYHWAGGGRGVRRAP